MSNIRREPFCQGPDWKPRASTKVEGTCGACGKALVGLNKWFCRSPHGEQYGLGSCRGRYAANHFWGEARRAAIKRGGRRCARCDYQSDHSGHGLEVNHIVPREGRGYGNGCWNHQDNLETLCHDCHVETTTQQGRERKREQDPQSVMELG